MSNSLAKVHPELVSEWSERNFPLTPDNITYGSNKRVWWKGSCGHEWQASVKARSKGEGCPICSGARVVEGINDLATVKPKLSLEWSEKNTIKPTEVTAVIAAATLVCGMSVTAFAASDPITVVNNLSDFIFGLIRAIGLILLGFGIVQVGLSLKSHDPSQRANGFLTLAGGIIITFAKEILTLITG